MIDDETSERVEFEADGETLRICDALEGEELLLRADREVDSQPALPDLFPFPVDRAISFETESLSIPVYSAVSVRDDGGEFMAQLDETMELPHGSYCFDISGVTKALVRITDAEVTATGMADSGPVELTFDRPQTVTVGARSLHTRPEATITVPDDPAALAEAVSVFGSSIKEFSPERSWPTLRGYPPRIERGDELDIPSPLVAPDTGVEIVVKPIYADIYRLSTLAYYLGARMVVGDGPAIRLDTGYVETLPTDGVALEKRIEELLRTWFFLDTLACTEGYVPSDRYEYEQVGPELPFYPPNLAGLSMSERLMEYLEVDSQTVAPYTPDWPTEAVLRPTPDSMDLLSHLAHVLAPVRVRGATGPSRPDAPNALATSPWLAPEDGIPDPDADPLSAGVSVLMPAGYENLLRRTRTASGEARVVVMVDSAQRAGAVRRALSEPAVPDGIGSWEVIDRPDRETATDVLGDEGIDIAYCGLPVEGDRVVAGDGAVALDTLGSAPAMTVFEETRRWSIGSQCLADGALLTVLLDSTLEPVQLRRLFALITAGSPVSVSLPLSIPMGRSSVQIVGDPSIVVATNRGLSMNINSIRSVSPTIHEVTRIGVLSQSTRVGGQQRMLFDGFDGHDQLIGVEQNLGEKLRSSQVVDLFDHSDAIVCLNGELILPSDGVSEESITAAARRALSEDSAVDCLLADGLIACDGSIQPTTDHSSTE